MIPRAGFVLTVFLTVLFGVGGVEAACRAGGDYRVTGPNVAGYLTLTETGSGEGSTTGTATLSVTPKLVCPVCLVATHTLTGAYLAAAGYDGCFVELRLRHPLDPIPERTLTVGGPLAFGGAVILFSGYESLSVGWLSVDLNLTLGIRSDGILKP
jgi:hypothetical protein